MPATNPFLSADIFDALHELLRLFRSRMRKSMESIDPELTFNETRVLMHVGQRPGVTQKDLVERSHTDKAQMARTLAQLQDKGWLERSAGMADKRVRCLHLSAQGRELYARLRGMREALAAELLQDCPAELQTQLLDLLHQARDSARRHGQPPDGIQ